MFWTGILPHNVPVRDILSFNENTEDIFEEWQELMQNAVAAGVSEVVDNLEFK